MSESKVFLTGHIDVPIDRLEQVRAALPKHIALTRAEPGCLSFEVTEDVETPGRFNVNEVFRDQASFDAHQERTQNSDWFRITQGIPRTYQITKG
ncbi:Antibiotic biosynthesis monooxygenase [Ruegeria sp. THAF57]|uniref:putative quinol monooxygenase n=1 Tax=Ruegeria sp. THAF57 TaxID=2744555 RepID=UPI0015DE93CD|nr:putative quinol monooxygenase [Ruegeria sp. THAF57]CAD0185471.1 Antibiotic biosynthesis monooxygenase [Ruegeria sp. THAF57]